MQILVGNLMKTSVSENWKWWEWELDFDKLAFNAEE